MRKRVSSSRTKLYRGLSGKYDRNQTGLFKDIEFYTTSIHQARTFAGKEGEVIKRRRDFSNHEVVEFPVRTRKDGTRDFDKLEFDRKAKTLKPGQVLVAKNVVDVGPRASSEVDPNYLWSYGADIYAIKKGGKIHYGRK
jgi:hypothetical protein